MIDRKCPCVEAQGQTVKNMRRYIPMKRTISTSAELLSHTLPRLIATALALAVVMLGATVLVKENEVLRSAFECASVTSLGAGAVCGTVYAVFGIYARVSETSFKKGYESEECELAVERVMTEEELKGTSFESEETNRGLNMDYNVNTNNNSKESDIMDKKKLIEIADCYFRTTVSRFYTPEQKERLARLFLESEGFARNTSEYDAVMNAIMAVESEEIQTLNDAKNFKLFFDMMESSELEYIVVQTFLNSFSAIVEKGVLYNTYLEWIIAMRTGNGTAREELAYYEWACGNIPSAILEFKGSMSKGEVHAVQFLGAIYSSMDNVEEAYFHYSLLDEVYRNELRSPAPLFLAKRIEELVLRLTDEQRRDIDRRVSGVLPFLGGKKNTIGFLAQ